MLQHAPDIQCLQWEDIREQVKSVAPDLFGIIEQLNPDKSYRLYRAYYPFGAMLIGQEGIFNVPRQGRFFPIIDIRLENQLREDLGYNQLGIPMSLMLKGQTQLYTEELDNIVTETLFVPGSMLALRAVLDPPLSYQARRYWRMTSGVRTPHMLPGISDQSSFNRLKKAFDLISDKPRNQNDHWKLFVEIANHENFPQKWGTEILFFSSKWLEPRNDAAWKLFRLALFERAWKTSAYQRNTNIVNKLWRRFISSLRNKKATPFVVNMVRYIIEASLGQAVSYVPDDGTNNSGPFRELSDVFIDIYGLKKYAPIVMLPYFIAPNFNRPAYISIQAPSTHWVNAGDHNENNLIGDSREIKHELDRFLEQIATSKISVDDTPFSTLTTFCYKFYHADLDKYGKLLPTATIFEKDKAVEHWLTHKHNSQIADRNTFLRSSVKIVQKISL
jgi:hypothetical protein